MDASREPQQRVPTLEQEHQPPARGLFGQGLRRAAHRREAALGGQHPPERIVLVRVEPGGDDDDVGAERVSDGEEDLVECRSQVRVGPSGGEGDVHRVSGSGPLAGLVGCAGPRIEGVLVHRLVEHVAALPEDGLRPVPVVHVPVEDQHPCRAQRPRRLRGHRRVVDEAEPHHPVRLGVMPRRAHQRKGGPVRAAEHRLHRLDPRARGRQRRVVGAGRGEGVDVDGDVGTGQVPELLQQLRVVDAGDLLRPRKARGPELERREPVLLQVLQRA